MDQVKTGQFIGQLRKEKSMTQKDLADRLKISDKTVSKWETGKGLPDAALFEPICEIFDITVTDLLAGARLTPDEFSKKAEENIMELMKENQNNKSAKVQLVIGIIAIVVGFLFMLICSAGNEWLYSISFMIDLPTLIMLLLYNIGGAFIAGAKSKMDYVKIIRKITFPIGIFVSLYSLIIVLRNIATPELIGPNLAVVVLTLLYSAVIYLVFTLIDLRINKIK